MFDAEGNVDASRKSKITGVLDPETAVRIKEKVAAIGDKAWDRPGHLTDGVLFYQLPPSKGYHRGGTVDYGNRAIPAFKVFEDDDAKWLMADCWGTKKQIELLKKLGDSWLEVSEGTPRTVENAKGEQEPIKPFGVGDISGFNKGPMSEAHKTHLNGDSTDLNRFGNSNGICHTGQFRTIYYRNQTYALCELLANSGVKRILFNCHYIIKNIPIAQELTIPTTHHHHIHFDGPEFSGNGPMGQGRFTTCAGCSSGNLMAPRPDQMPEVWDPVQEPTEPYAEEPLLDASGLFFLGRRYRFWGEADERLWRVRTRYITEDGLHIPRGDGRADSLRIDPRDRAGSMKAAQ